MKYWRLTTLVITLMITFLFSGDLSAKTKGSSRKKSSQSKTAVNLDDIELDVEDADTPTRAPSSTKKTVSKSKNKKSKTEEHPDQFEEFHDTGDDKLAMQAAELLANDDAKGVIALLNPSIDKLNRRGLLSLARAYRLENDFKAELHALQLASGKGKNDYVLQTLIADSYASAGKADEAIAVYKQAIEFNKRYRKAYEGLLAVFEQQRETYEARTLVNEMIKTFGKNPQYQSALCRLYSVDDFMEKAVEACQAAVRIDPQNADNYVHLGINLRDQLDTKQASKVLENAAQRFPASEPVQFATADLRASNKDYSTAYDHFKKAVIADPKSARSWTGLGNSAFELQKNDEAIEAYVSACKIDRKLAKDFRLAISKLRERKDTKLVFKYEDALGRCDK